jgi:DNA-binding transcriptional ArsR family regulator
MSLLPSRPDASPDEDAGPRVIDVDSEDADDVLSALSSSTARKLLKQLHEEPSPPSELADTVDTSVQNAKYHLEKLEAAGAIEMDVYAPADQPLVIYAGDEEDGGTLRTALSRLLGSVGILALASLAIQSIFGETLFPWTESADGGQPATDGGTDTATANESEGGTTTETDGSGQDGGDAGEMGTTDADGDTAIENGTEIDGGDNLSEINETVTNGNVTEAPTGDEVQTATDAAASIPPGLLFFLGGLLVILLIVGYLYLRDDQIRPVR